jgi:hypothetical protein
MYRQWHLDNDGLRDLLFADTRKLSAIADECKGRHNSGVTGSKDLPHLAEFPAELVEKYIADNGITFYEWMNNPVHVRRMLHDPALAHFRINTMKVGRAVE